MQKLGLDEMIPGISKLEYPLVTFDFRRGDGICFVTLQEYTEWGYTLLSIGNGFDVNPCEALRKAVKDRRNW